MLSNKSQIFQNRDSRKNINPANTEAHQKMLPPALGSLWGVPVWSSSSDVFPLNDTADVHVPVHRKHYNAPPLPCSVQCIPH